MKNSSTLYILCKNSEPVDSVLTQVVSYSSFSYCMHSNIHRIFGASDLGVTVSSHHD